MKQDWLWLFLKGLAMGAADVVPGVSGGTIALITGIYERLVGALSRLDIRQPFKSIDWRLFVPLGLGIVVAVLLFANVIHGALENFPGQTYAFFFGLILVSAWLVWQKITSPPAFAGTSPWKRRGDVSSFGAIAMGIVFAYLFVGLNPLESDHSLLTVFLSGAVAIMAMMLPGISGSFLLLFLGQYEFILNAVRGLVLPVLIVFVLGIAAGVLVFSRVLKHLMQKHRSLTMAFLVGMMLGSLRLPYREIVAAGTSLISVIAFVVIGFAGVLLLERLAQSLYDRS